jgi:hypothetical protein
MKGLVVVNGGSIGIDHIINKDNQEEDLYPFFVYFFEEDEYHTCDDQCEVDQEYFDKIEFRGGIKKLDIVVVIQKHKEGYHQYIKGHKICNGGRAEYADGIFPFGKKLEH